MCWRVTLSSAVVGMLGTLLLGLFELAGSSQVNMFYGITSVLFGLGPAPLFGMLAAATGPRLKRYFPFSQGILFGLMGAATCGVVFLVIDGLIAALNPCPANGGCIEPLSVALIVTMFAGFPLTLMAGVGLTTAIHVSNSRRRARIFFALLVATSLLFFTVQALGLLR